jgi:hypothetical protein
MCYMYYYLFSFMICLFYSIFYSTRSTYSVGFYQDYGCKIKSTASLPQCYHLSPNNPFPHASHPATTWKQPDTPSPSPPRNLQLRADYANPSQISNTISTTSTKTTARTSRKNCSGTNISGLDPRRVFGLWRGIVLRGV